MIANPDQLAADEIVAQSCAEETDADLTPVTNENAAKVQPPFEVELLALLRAQNKMIRDIRTVAVFFALTTITLFFLAWIIGAMR